MLQDALQEITGFTTENFAWTDILHEFSAKFGHTFMKVNGIVQYVRDAGYDNNKEQYYLRTQNNVLYDKDILNIAPFRPKVGSYWTTDGYVVTFRKTAKKMWKKSLCIGENYYIAIYNSRTKKNILEPNYGPILAALTDAQYTSDGYISNNRQFIFTGGDILFNGIKIGEYKHGGGTLTEIFTIPLWAQEIVDVFTYEIGN